MATFFVTTTADSGAGSLRQAIIDANLAAGADVIDFGSTSGTITLLSELSITDDLTIDGDTTGDDKADIILDGGGATRILNIAGGLSVGLDSLTFQNGFGGDGGAVLAGPGAALTISDTTFQNNDGSRGGALRADGLLTITDTTFSGNTAGDGGGLYLGGLGNATITNTTFDGNGAGRGGGIHVIAGTINLLNTTVTGNTAITNGGGISTQGGATVGITNSVVALNTGPSGADIGEAGAGGTVNALNSFFGTDATANITTFNDLGGNQNNAGDPLLAALADNGGTVQTRLVQAGSNLIDAGDNGSVTTPEDANGNSRIDGASVDIGASESQVPGPLVVSTAVDENDGDFSAGDLSLREAVLLAGTGDTITFDAALAGQTLTLASEIALADDIIIDGDSNGDDKADVTLSGGGTNRIFNISGATTDVDLLSLTLDNGSVASVGGAIFGSGFTTLDISDTTISNSSATGALASGGGIYVTGTGVTTLTDSLLTGNTALNQGGGIYALNGQTLTLTNTTVHGNTADGFGGGLSAANSATINLFNSTITGNQADADGAGTNNGGGIDDFGATINIYNSVIAENTSGTAFTADDVSGTIDIANHSFIGANETITTNTNSTNNGGTPGLDALADNGGTTQTRAISPGSALVNAGNNTYAPTQDANGNARIVGGTVDIGATETQLVVDHLSDVDTVGATLAGDILDDGGLSLREAIAHAGAGDSISFAGGLAGTVTLTQGVLVLTQDVNIDGDTNGDEKADVIIDGAGASRVISVNNPGTDVDLHSLTLTGGSADRGGALRLYTDMSVDLINSTVSGNAATVNGGGIYNQGGTLNVTGSTISGNSAANFGGGLHNQAGTATLTNTTIDGNASNSLGGGIMARGTVNLYNSTITSNRADADGPTSNFGGGIFDGSATINVTNSVIALNTSGVSLFANDIGGTIDIATNSFIGTTETITTSTNTINGGGDPLLAALADNGGPVETRAIQQGSALIDAGDDALVPIGVTTDANGDARIVTNVDIGATESTIALVVDTLVDENNGDFSAGDLSLREAISIVSDGGTITFADGLSGVVRLNGTQLTLSNQVTINGDTNGDGRADIIISGDANGDDATTTDALGNIVTDAITNTNTADNSRVFSLASGADVTLSSLTITGGFTTGNGGGIFTVNYGNSLTVENSTIIGNRAYDGGGIYSGYASLTVSGSTIQGNVATDDGGGLHIYTNIGGAFQAEIVNTTIVGNTAVDEGGGIRNLYGITVVQNATITGNSAANGGGISSYGDASTSTELASTIVALNTGSDVALQGATDSFAASPGNNLIGDGNGLFTNGVFGNIVGTTGTPADPGLGALADNGGPVATMNLDGDSQAINAGAYSATAGSTDANGDARTVAGTVDIGATEFQLVVTTELDSGLDNTIDGNLAADIADGGGLSLREAIGHAAAGDEISFAAALFGQTITLSGTQLDINTSLTINGDSDGDKKADITISGDDASRIINISNNAALDIQSLTLTNGNAGNINAANNGGAIRTDFGTTLNIVDSTIANSSGYTGGGIHNYGTLYAVNTLFANNTAAENGGGLHNRLSSANATLVNSTFYGNSAGNIAGAILNSLANLTLISSTIVNNSSSTSVAGGLFNFGDYVTQGNVNIDNSVFADNLALTATAPVADDVSDQGGTVNVTNSLFGIDETSQFDVNVGNLIGPAGLGELLDNGGTVLTLSPLDGSALIGAGNNAQLPADSFDLDNDGNTAEPLPLDARGGVRVLDTTVDIGAVEQFENETIGGTDGNNNIIGGLGDDVMDGRGGTDTVDYSNAPGGVTVSLAVSGPQNTGAAGTDTLSNFQNLRGSNFADTLTGDANDNTIEGLGFGDTISAGAGNDIVDAGEGVDTVFGGGGNDDIAGAGGGDSLFGQADDDTIRGGNGNDTINGGGGVDNLFGDANDDTIFGGTGLDTLNGGSGADQLFGQGDADDLFGGNGNDTLDGGGGNDRLFGQADIDILRGNIGDDFLNGGGGDDFLFGQAGNDTLHAGTGNDLLTGGGGNDRMFGEDGADRLFGGGGQDELFGGAGDDFVVGNSDVDLVDGGSGADTVLGDAGNDTLLGNAGDDVLDGGADDDNIFGQADNDRLLGNNGNDTLGGGGGNDELFGQAGNDTLDGGIGNDILGGGGGTDNFVFLAGWGQDTITDFANGTEFANVSGAGVSAGAINVVTVGANAVVDFGGTDMITFIGQAGNIDVSDFIF